MSLSAISSAPVLPTDSSSTRDSSTDDSTTAKFAGMFAAAAHAHTPKPVAVAPKDGTSELDGSDASSDATGASDDATGTSDAADAAGAAIAAAATSTAVVQTITALNPELQAKLARVIDRVRAETGHDVTIAETYRSQSRQDVLYAQGRDTSGPVVTWTQNSKHTQGRAVDVLLDNGNAGAAAYASLQRIASEEGLRTLGARDPGHLELPGAGTATDVTSLTPAAPADASGPGQVSIARLSQLAQITNVSVARPAQVAQVAQVARVATVATVASAPSAATVGQPAVQAKPGATVRTMAPVQAATTGKSTSVAGLAPTQTVNAKSTDADAASKQSDGDSSERGSQNNGDQRGVYSTFNANFATRDIQGAPVTSVATGTTAAERTAKVIAAIEDAPARPLSQITMSVDAGNGATDRIHVAMRGSSLSSTIDVGDARTAQVMGARGDELIRSLARDGVQVDSLQVRAAAGTGIPVATQSQGSSNSSTNSRSEAGNPWQQRERQQAQEDRRQQQQREQREAQQK